MAGSLELDFSEIDDLALQITDAELEADLDQLMTRIGFSPSDLRDLTDYLWQYVTDALGAVAQLDFLPEELTELISKLQGVEGSTYSGQPLSDNEKTLVFLVLKPAFHKFPELCCRYLRDSRRDEFGSGFNDESLEESADQKEFRENYCNQAGETFVKRVQSLGVDLNDRQMYQVLKSKLYNKPEVQQHLGLAGGLNERVIKIQEAWGSTQGAAAKSPALSFLRILGLSPEDLLDHAHSPELLRRMVMERLEGPKSSTASAGGLLKLSEEKQLNVLLAAQTESDIQACLTHLSALPLHQQLALYARISQEKPSIFRLLFDKAKDRVRAAMMLEVALSQVHTDPTLSINAYMQLLSAKTQEELMRAIPLAMEMTE